MDQITKKLRSKGIGASEAPAVLGLSRYKTALDVYLRKRELIPPDRDNDLMQFGRIFEPAIVQLYEQQWQTKLQYPMRTRRHPEHRFILATPDAAINAKQGVEIKSMEWHIAKKIDEQGLDEALPEYLIQCQQQMLVMGWETVTIVALVHRKLRTWVVERNEDIHAHLIDRETEFWQHVLDGVPPPANLDHVRALQSVKAMFGKVEGHCVRLSEEATNAWLEYERLGQEEKALKARRDSLRAAALLELGDNEAGVLADGKRMLFRAERQPVEVAYERKAYIDTRAKKYDGRPITREATPLNQLIVTQEPEPIGAQE